MKRKMLLSVALLCAALTFNAQKLYLNLGAGYGLNAYGYNYGESNVSGNTTTFTSKNLNMGTGLNFGLRAGYMLNQNLAFELGLGYRMHKSEFVSQYKNVFGSNEELNTYKDNYSFKMLQIPLTLRLSAGENKMKYYTRFGLNLGLGAKIVEESEITYVTTYTGSPSIVTTDVRMETWEYNGGLSIGVVGGFGILYQLNDKMGLTFELNGNAQGYAPKRGVMTKYTFNGTDMMPNMTTSDKEIEYVNDYSYDSSNPPSDSQPTKELKFAWPLNTWGIGIGFNMNIGGE